MRFELRLNCEQRFFNFNTVPWCSLGLLAPYKNESNNHQESDNKDDNPNNLYFGNIFIISEAKLNDEGKVHVMVLGNDSNIFSVDYTWICIFDYDLQLFVELKLCQMVSMYVIK